jgi:Arc/MetJ family transcription regulator
MRTNIEIDDDLMKAAMEATGAKTKREAVEAGLKTVIRLRNQAEFRKMRGAFKWEGNLEESRLTRFPDWE